MRYPAFLYGTAKKVGDETKKIVEKLKKDLDNFDIQNEEMTIFDPQKK
jgi:hypothetical protein